MTARVSDIKRRRFIKLTATGIAVAPFAATLFSPTAEAAEMLTESDATAAALKYKADATKAAERKDATAFCNNCNFYNGKPTDPNGPCTVFGGKLVASKGWCMSWGKKA
jgi:hypothetical protein